MAAVFLTARGRFEAPARRFSDGQLLTYPMHTDRDRPIVNLR